MESRDIRSRSDVFIVAVLAVCAGYVLALGFVPGVKEYSPLACFLNRALGVHCPTCGLTRAVACCARLEFDSALRFNPLVVFFVPFVAAYTADLLMRIAGRAGLLASVPAVVASASWVACAAVFAVLLVVRTGTWIMPDLNPDGWLIPPSSFPEGSQAAP